MKSNKHLILAENYSYSILLGDLQEPSEHKHLSMHLTTSLTGGLKANINGKTVKSEKTLIIASNEKHYIEIKEQEPIMVVNLSPASNIGLYLKGLLKKQPYIQLTSSGISQALKETGLKLYLGKVNQKQFTEQIEGIFESIITEPTQTNNNVYDERIVKAILFIFENSTKTLPAEIVASHVCLSVGRFLHLFKQETDITYRRMQIWIKLVQSFWQFPRANSLTELAHNCGFADSAHFCREFKQTFGTSPAGIFKK